MSLHAESINAEETKNHKSNNKRKFGQIKQKIRKFQCTSHLVKVDIRTKPLFYAMMTGYTTAKYQPSLNLSNFFKLHRKRPFCSKRSLYPLY